MSPASVAPDNAGINKPYCDQYSHLKHSEETDAKLEEMISYLTSEEIEIAARSTYQYIKEPKKYNQRSMAKRMARRYLESKKDINLAREKMKKTIKFRMQTDVDGLRRAFDDNDNDETTTNDHRLPLEKIISLKSKYVQGFDKDGRSTQIFIPRMVTNHDNMEYVIKEWLYSLERAIACSKADDSSVNVVIDFNGFDVLKNSPPLSVGKESMLILRNHYVGQINKIFIIDAPTSFTFLWRMIKPFIGTSTKSKIQLLSGDKQKRIHIGKLYSANEVSSWMLPNGTKNKELDVKQYLYDTSFDKAFNN